MSRVRVIAGTARSDRAARIDALLAESPDRSLLIVPTEQHARLRTSALLRESGRAALLDPPVVTFDGLVRRILRGTPLEHARIDPLVHHLLLRRVVGRVAGDRRLEAIGAAAQTEGFLDHLLSIISQLKQAAIEPDDFARRIKNARRKNPMDGVVAAVYGAYQDELQRTNAVDLQGMYWLARNVCEEACPSALQPIEHLLLDEFDDFTPSEFRVIEQAARHVECVTFGLNVDLGPAQRDLYAIPRETLERIRSAFPGVEVDSCDEPAPSRATEFVATALLVRDSVPVPKSMRINLEFVECHTIDNEIESIARRIKRLIRVHGIAPSDIAVVLRRPSSVAETIADVFDEFGIPLAGAIEFALGQTALGGFVLHLIEAVQSWSEIEIVDLVSSPWFVGPNAPHADAFHTLARAARPRPSRHGWERSAGILAKRIGTPFGDEMEKLARHMPHAADACAVFQSAVERLLHIADALSRPATLPDFALALDDILAGLPIDAALSGIPDDRGKARETAGREALFRTLARLHDAGGANLDGKLELADFSRLLRRAFSLVIVRPGADPDPGVDCLDMESARYLAYEHVFLVGMTDDAVPARPSVSALYAEDERAELRELGVPLDDALKHNRREILLFQRMFSMARGSVTIAWHRITRGGQATQRSLFVEEVADRLPEVLPDRPASALRVHVPEADGVACERDLRNLVFAEDRLSGLAKDFEHVRDAVRIELARHDFEPCGIHDAVLPSGDSLDAVRAKHGPDAEFSATALEKYARCPFAYFQDRVLHLFAVEPTEKLLDARVRGSVLHGALEKFHREFVGRAVAEIDPRDAAEAMQRAVGAAFEQAVKSYGHIAGGLLEAEKSRLARALDQYLMIAQEKDDPRWKPSEFEVSFGHTRSGREGAAAAFSLDLDGETVRIAGRIDRIDRDGETIRVVDYKTSKVAPREIDEKLSFQLALYAMAARSVVRDAVTCETASYIAVGKARGETIALSREGDEPDWEKRITLARDAVANAIGGIRGGVFHPTLRDEACRGCAAEKVCRYERARMRRKGGA